MAIYQRDNRYDRSEIVNIGIRASVWPGHGVAIGPDAKINSTSENAILIDPTHGPTITKMRNSPDSIAIGDVTRIINSRESIIIGKNLGVTNEDRVVKIGNDDNYLKLDSNGIFSIHGSSAAIKLPNVATASLPGSAEEGTLLYDSTTKTVKVWNGTVWLPL